MYDKTDIVKLGWDIYATRNVGDRHLTKDLEYLSRFENLLHKNSNILIAGCGTGKPVISYYLSKNHKITGIDISKNQIEKAKHNFPSVNFVVGNMLDILKCVNQYDAIVCLRSIDNIQREYHKKLLDIFYNCLRGGGKLLLSHPLMARDVVIPFFEDIQMYFSNFDYQTFASIIGSTKFKTIFKKIDNDRVFFILSKISHLPSEEITFKPQIIYSSQSYPFAS